jgi:hypothetical protein
VSIKDRTDCWPDDLGPFNWPHTSSWVSLNPAIPYVKRQSRTGSGEMARVACTPGKRLHGEYCALGWRRPVHVVGDPWEWLTYARVKCYIYRVVGDRQLGINRFRLPLLLGYEDWIAALHRR